MIQENTKEKIEECVFKDSGDPDYGYFPYQCTVHGEILPMGVLPQDVNNRCPGFNKEMEKVESHDE